MLADGVRNSMYRAAIERAVYARPGCSVIDIGAGSGLLGVIASRAGAARVDCVEMNVPLAAAARQCLAASQVPNHAVWNASRRNHNVTPM
jgi:type II protein arginine methyltransferase